MARGMEIANTHLPWSTRIRILQVSLLHRILCVRNKLIRFLEITQGLDLLWRSKIDPRKVLLGLGLYGRSFTLNNTNCNTPGCPFDKSAYGAGGGAPGQCTQTSGILSDYEINRILEDYEPAIKYDETAGVNWITWNDNQWYAYLRSLFFLIAFLTLLV